MVTECGGRTAAPGRDCTGEFTCLRGCNMTATNVALVCQRNRRSFGSCCASVALQG